MEGLVLLAQMVIDKFPIIGVIGAYGVVLVTGIGVLIEIVEVVAKLTPSQKDDEAIEKAKALKKKVIGVLELLPHVNIPIAPVVLKVIEVLKKIAKGAKAATEKEEK